jgi:hypothetical protein
VEGPWQQQNLDAGASLLIPVPASGGAVVVGESVVSFIAAGGVRSTAIKPTLVKVRAARRGRFFDRQTAWRCCCSQLPAVAAPGAAAFQAPPSALACQEPGLCRLCGRKTTHFLPCIIGVVAPPRVRSLHRYVSGFQASLRCRPAVPLQAYGQVDEDGSRFLLSDMLGNLYLLLLLRDDGGTGGSTSGGSAGGVAALKLEPLGRTPAASTISYLDSGVVFVGSSLGDSQLIRCVAAQCPAATAAAVPSALPGFTSRGAAGLDLCCGSLSPHAVSG